jgi:hypothetical protein
MHSEASRCALSIGSVAGAADDAWFIKAAVMPISDAARPRDSVLDAGTGLARRHR